jgi:hypothetical protein
MFSSKSTAATVLLALCLFNLVGGENWQASGALNQTVMNFIWAHIGTNFPTYAGGASLIPYCTLLSEGLNGKWDLAWNVFAVKLMDPTFDAVLVGYAFNDQWMWHSGYSYNGNFYAFVIWKDYNCKTWNTFSLSNFLTVKTSSDPFYSMWQVYMNTVNTVF